MSEADELLKSLNELAKKMMEDAVKPDTPLPHKLDVFKICSQHYVSLAKIKGKGDPDDDRSPMTMGSLRERVAGGQGDTNESSSSSE